MAYCLSPEFCRQLRSFCDSRKQGFLPGRRMLHGDYKRLVGDDMRILLPIMNAIKGLYSSFNSMNLFEIVHSLLRQFTWRTGHLLQGKHLLSFCR